jgi:uncharacterized protein
MRMAENPIESAKVTAPKTPRADADRYVGTLVGESTSTEFRLAVAHETIREQDLIAVDAEIRKPETEEREAIRVWAKVKRIERLNPLFPTESGHELAATKTSPFDTVLSLSREMVSAVCQVLGSEPLDASSSGKLNSLRYPPQPASSAYRPSSEDITRVVVGELQQDERKNRALDIAHLANRPDVDVKVDGHAIVVRHVAILAMTGSGKTWTARRVIEQLAKRNYPIVIFDPRGDYTGLADIPELRDKVTRYFAEFPLFEEDSQSVGQIINSLGYPLTPTMATRFDDVFAAAQQFYVEDAAELKQRTDWLAITLARPEIAQYGLRPNMWLIAHLAAAGEKALRDGSQPDQQQLQNWGWPGITSYSGTDARTLEGIKKRTYKAAGALTRMEQTNRKIARTGAQPLPTNKTGLVQYGRISIVALAGYTGDFQATIYSLVADAIFSARVSDELKLPALLVVEEAHNFCPGRASTAAEERSIIVTRQIAQEGRKFQVGLILISQRPGRLDETALSMCNSYVIMKMINPADQSFVRKVVESLGEDDARMLPDLDKGEAILSGEFISFPVLVKIKPPLSRGEREEKDAFVALEEAQDEIKQGAAKK